MIESHTTNSVRYVIRIAYPDSQMRQTYGAGDTIVEAEKVLANVLSWPDLDRSALVTIVRETRVVTTTKYEDTIGQAKSPALCTCPVGGYDETETETDSRCPVHGWLPATA